MLGAIVYFRNISFREKRLIDRKKIWSALVCIVMTVSLLGQPSAADSSQIDKSRLRIAIAGGTLLYGGTMIGLSQIWYVDYEQSSFHFFNDNHEYLQMDKVGHAVTAYHFAQAAMSSLQWAGLPRNKARNYGIAYGLLYQNSIELLDGYSAEWGASTGDLIANTAGGLAFWGQDVLWKEQRITLKYSYSTSQFADLRPELYGENSRERWLKDYNGQTYWASVNIGSFLNGDNQFPKWLNVSGGYGIDGLTGACRNVENLPHFDRERQWYLALDADLWRIPTRSKALKIALKTLSFVKIPAPTLEITGGQTKFHWFYF